MATKLELQQTNIKLAADNNVLREMNSVLATDNKFLREKLADRDHLARKLIASHNRPVSARRVAMDAARAKARELGCVVKAGGDHV